MVLGIIIGVVISWTVLSLLCYASEYFRWRTGLELFDGWLATVLLIPSYIILFIPFKIYIAIKKVRERGTHE